MYEDPGPEFYKSLKRETDEIIKITEEEHTKYKKKEIQSNWAKYEMPIESYEEIEEQENLGADYEASHINAIFLTNFVLIGSICLIYSCSTLLLFT